MRTLIAGAGAVTLAAMLAAPADAAEQVVSYHGYELTVPASWPVFHLDTDPAECVRFDRNAVYLGKPGSDQQCQAGLRQVTDAVLVEPVGDQVRVTVTGDKLRGYARQVEEPAEAPTIMTVQPGVYTGHGFDACAAPSQGAMDAWLGSQFRAIGVYIGGIHRACAQPNLTPGWVKTQTSKGWRLIPTYVGRQAPCTSFRYKVDLDPGLARTQGREAGADAADLAAKLGLAAGTVLYNDMEAYNNADAACSAAVMSFLSGWTDLLRERGYQSGVYSSASSGITDLVLNYQNSAYSRPDHIWFAWWNGIADVEGGQFLPAGHWPQRRIHQFAGGHDEVYNGVTINIDSNYLDVRG
jgi:hypothetical protein